MVGIYFSGTGNTKHCVTKFLSECSSSPKAFSIEDSGAIQAIKNDSVIVFAYPVYFSNLPKIVRDFIVNNQNVFIGKNIFIIATMGLFSGDGAGCSARLFSKYGANIIGGLHLKMSDCISDEKALKKTLEQNEKLVIDSDKKIIASAKRFNNNTPTRDGIGLLYHLAGLFGQRLWFYGKTKKYSDKLKINLEKCVGCGACVKLCPLENIEISGGKAHSFNRCTMCYRCVNSCPHQAITLLGKKLYEQHIYKHISEID